MEFVIVTGLSGAGRSTALRRLEDLKYFCVDNLMPQLLPQFAKNCLENEVPITKVAVAVDSRMGDWFSYIYDAIDELKQTEGINLNILFLDAKDETLIKRFKSTRRPHPVSQSGEIVAGIHAERHQLQRIKDMATRVIDTSQYSLLQLYNVIDNYYKDSDSKMLISVISFGYKRGIPLDADLVFDMRFLPNPFYVEELKNKSGQNADVSEYIFAQKGANEFVAKIVDMVNYIIPMFLNQDKKQLVIGIGCTGGMHRSVATAEKLAEELKKCDHNVYLEHRDLILEKTVEG